MSTKRINKELADFGRYVTSTIIRGKFQREFEAIVVHKLTKE